jgi:hypothetical protein
MPTLAWEVGAQALLCYFGQCTTDVSDEHEHFVVDGWGLNELVRICADCHKECYGSLMPPQHEVPICALSCLMSICCHARTDFCAEEQVQPQPRFTCSKTWTLESPHKM